MFVAFVHSGSFPLLLAMLLGVSFGSYSLPATVLCGLGEADLIPCLVDGHLDPDQENQNVKCPWPVVHPVLDRDLNGAEFTGTNRVKWLEPLRWKDLRWELS